MASPRSRRPARRLGRPPATDGEVTRAGIIRAAEACFAEHGYAGATNADIADRVGLTSGAIYHHFGSKADLYAEVCADATIRIIRRLSDNVAPFHGFVERLEAVVAGGIGSSRDYPTLAPFTISAANEARRQPDIAEPVEAMLAAMRTFWTQLVLDGIESGEVPPDVDVASSVGVIQALGWGLGQIAIISSPEELEGVTQACRRLLRGTLFVTSPPGDGGPGS